MGSYALRISVDPIEQWLEGSLHRCQRCAGQPLTARGKREGLHAAGVRRLDIALESLRISPRLQPLKVSDLSVQLRDNARPVANERSAQRQVRPACQHLSVCAPFQRAQRLSRSVNLLCEHLRSTMNISA